MGSWKVLDFFVSKTVGTLKRHKWLMSFPIPTRRTLRNVCVMKRTAAVVTSGQRSCVASAFHVIEPATAKVKHWKHTLGGGGGGGRAGFEHRAPAFSGSMWRKQRYLPREATSDIEYCPVVRPSLQDETLNTV